MQLLHCLLVMASAEWSVGMGYGGQVMEELPAPNFGGQMVEDFPGPSYGGQKVEDFPGPSYGGQKVEDFPGPSHGGQTVEDFPGPSYGGQKVEEFPGPSYGGQTVEEFPGPSYGGQTVEEFPGPTYGGQKIEGYPGQTLDKSPSYGGQTIEEFPGFVGQTVEKLPDGGQTAEEFPPSFVGQTIEESPHGGQMAEEVPSPEGQRPWGEYHQVQHHSYGVSQQHIVQGFAPQTPDGQLHHYMEGQHGVEFIQGQEEEQLPVDLPHEVQADPHYDYSGSPNKPLSGWRNMKQFTLGTCSTRLSTPMNAALKCSTFSGCQATCLRGYTFPSGETRIFFVCDNGKWKVKGSLDEVIPQCKPVCIPPCQNGGHCVSPNTCDCPEPFSGPYCQYERKRCIGFPPTPNNARKVCNSESCTITCLEQHQFPDGSGIANVFCKEGEWSPARPDWPTIPDCKPTCIPECQNGGSCLAFNMCNCPQQFRGPHCQYSVDACDSRKLNFNGNYNCSESGGRYSCSLSCPVGMDFQTTPAVVYTCLFSEGRFNPPTVPQCVFSGEQEQSELELVFSHKPGGMMLNETELVSKYRAHKVKYPGLPGGYSDLINNVFVLEKKTPTAGTCVSWSGYHYRTFDGRVVSFKSGCTYTLASDVIDNTFQVQTSARNCTAGSCHMDIILYIGDKRYQLAVNDQGLPVVKSTSRQWSVPSQLSDLRSEIVGYSMVATLQGLGVSLRWNLQDMVEVKVTEAMWNRTGGLCGLMDGHMSNDLEMEHDSIVSYANRWQANLPSEKCTSEVEEDACVDSATQQAAHQFCNKLMVDKRYNACRKILPTRQYYEACRWDFCSCKDKSEEICACRSISMFVRDCLQKGEKSVENWRDNENCPVKCSGGRVYKACGPATVATCMAGGSEMVSSECEEGCYCPEGMRLHNGQCIPQEQCPCYLRARAFSSGQKVAKGCNTCECVKGQWVCTEAQCEARCAAIGDPHYQTFDGRRYNFMGKCSYYLLHTDNYTIDAENVACDGRVSERMGLSRAFSPSCTKAVTIRIGEDHVLKLKHNKEITVNNEDVESLPIVLAGAYVRAASSMFVQVEMGDGVEVWWDGQTRVYITAPPSLKGKTKGLCGTFNGNQKDDFLTPEGDVEQDPAAFADKWKTKEVCDNIDSTVSSHPCELHVQNRAAAERHCANITSSLFADCHFLVDPSPFYEDCLYDVCSCSGPLSECLCPVISSYAKECSFQGATIDWRDKVKECGVQCSGGQQYQACGSSCARSCSDLARPCPRHWQCVEGCYCPAGQTLGPAGECVNIAACPCTHHGMEYPPTHKEIKPGTKALQFCECKNAVWHCSAATSQQIKDYPNQSLDLKTSCSATRHQEFTHCEPPEPVTCKNMHNPPKFTASICHAGCVCKRGFVLDSLSRECVRPTQCPCHHGGHSYTDGHMIQEECNTCKCEAGKWNCTKLTCPGVCSAWGDSHFRSFDDRIFDFQGACDYMLAKGSFSETDSFNVALEIVPCGSSGVSCSKAVTLSVGSGDKHESITFSANKPLPAVSTLERITLRQAGLFVFAEVADLGIVLQWDKGTRVVLKADTKWEGRLKGLCGNYNGDEKDDFQTPSGGLSEVSAQLFGESWKLQPYCPEAQPITDTCKLHPSRKTWAVKKCGILKSAVFKPCHSEVSIEPYLDRCIFDTCGCDQGGDCECLCTALAAYAQQCNAHGVHIKWRTQELCPIQCDETCSEYKPCVQTCPLQTCDNLFTYKSLSKLCQQDTCVEGCDVKSCPEGQVYHNLTHLQCVPAAECKTVCLTVAGKVYYEGDLMEADNCHSCYCSRHKKTCTGQPCTSLSPTTLAADDEPMQCVSGWSEWTSSDHPISGKKESDVEPLPTPNQFISYARVVKGVRNATRSGQCAQEMMVDIECRTVGKQQHYKDTLQDVECSLEKGLVCQGKCDDYEIRVLCQCEKTTATTKLTTVSSTTTATTPRTTTQKALEVELCDALRPMTTHPSDCGRFYQCVETPSGLEQLERECAPLLWFNPQTMACDWPDRVKHVRPECIESLSKASCEDVWSEWVNVSHPASEDGDFETFSKIHETGLSLCPDQSGFIKDIQCQFLASVPAKISKKGGKKGGKKGKMVMEWVNKDYRESPDLDVMCSPHTGLTCLNYKQPDSMCEDYRIRVLCACDKKKEETIVEKGITEEPVTNPIAEGCRSDQQWLDCNLQCDQLCLYYDYALQAEGKCTTGRKCVPGCWPMGSPPSCPAGFRWREWGSCVRIDDCTCRSSSGAIVKPGEVVHESDCKVCMCENNHYTCDESACHTTVTTTTTAAPQTTVVTTVLILPSTVSPPPACDQDRLAPLLGELPHSAFATSSSRPDSEPWKAQMKSSGWRPADDKHGEYLQIDLGTLEPVYGVSTAGGALDHVTSYELLYSADNITYSYISLLNFPQTFRGSHTGEPLLQMFAQPVEARYVRILPQTWAGRIQLNVELLGCGKPVALKITTTEATTTERPTTELPTTSIPTTVLPVCTDDMGLDAGLLDPRQVKVSSSKQPHFQGRQAALSAPVGWLPLLNSPSEWIQFDFLEERTLTGIKTRGTPEAIKYMYEPAWVTTYKITYSHDGQNWNLILNSNHSEMVFLGNYDSSSVHINYFDKPIHARYVRVYPNTWHVAAAMKVEMLGCYIPYATLPVEVSTTTESAPTTEGLCNVCEGAPPVKPCPCSDTTWWDGDQCTARTRCPCYVGHIMYAVGSTYDTEDCDQCICSLNGQPRCSKKVCPSCSEGLQAVMTSNCGCVCKPCAEGTRLCPTSNVCVSSTVWCDGVVDCPDDELDCTTSPPPTTTTAPHTTTTQRARTAECPVVECPEGFTVNFTSNMSQPESLAEKETPSWSPFGTKSKWSSMFKGGLWGGNKGGKKGTKGLPPHKTRKIPSKMVDSPLVCPEYKCVPSNPKEKYCPLPKCADGYDLKMLEAKEDKCPEYTCEQRQIPEGKCNVTGRTFDTFDGTEYKYDICDHVLAQDMLSSQWQIKLKKICPFVGSCSKVLTISQLNHTIEFNTNLSSTYDGHAYSVPQCHKIGQLSRDFAVKQVSDKFIIFVSVLGYTVVWDVQGNVKITVPGSLQKQVDGLCGFFDGEKSNDLRKHDGNQARSSVEFGDSWGTTDCETRVCPLHVQNMAWELCSVIKKEPLSQCEGPVNLDKALSVCVESICACLDKNIADKEACRCQALLDVVTACQEVRPSVDLHTWRMIHNCPVDCPAPLVYKDCYSRLCEPGCSDLLQEDPCPGAEGECFPGCYCPEGLVREGNQCVKPTDCRDCVCDGFGRTRFVTFDRLDFSFSGNCTHVIAQTVENAQGPKFKVLATNGPCGDLSGDTCVKTLSVFYLDHFLLIGSDSTQQSVIVDGKKTNLPHNLNWANLSLSANMDITLIIPEIHLYLVFAGTDLGFSLKLPSHLYKGITEGLCGSCNNNQTDDFKLRQGDIVEDANKFAKSWRETNLPSVFGKEQQCEINVHQKNCSLPPSESDLCMKLMDEALFGRCHVVVDPAPFVSLCHESWCRNNRTGCQDLEPYAKECQTAGICLHWRSEDLCPYQCPPGLEYHACTLGCDITCDNVELFRNNPSACTNPVSESCLCPDNKVWKNNSCVLESRCQPCDVEGHYPGDVWHPDVCTTCTCQVSNSIQCERTQCPSTVTVCERGFKSIALQGTESDCCPKYICVPEPKQLASCPVAQQPICGYGQVMKTETTASGCQEFICQCMASEDCPDISGQIVFTEESGMHPVQNTSGCCPRWEEVCKPDTCPPPPSCPPYMELTNRDVERCCPQYKCEPPKDTCLYEMEYIEDSKGGERQRSPSEKFIVGKKGGESWQDGPCRVCECEGPAWRAKCSVQNCPAAPNEVDFVVEAFPQPKHCCPQYKRTACRLGNKVYKEGEVFAPTDMDPCKNLTCLRSESKDLVLHESIETCNKDCPLGWEYTEPIFSGRCCGECRPMACVVNGTLHPRGSSWQSDDNCTTFSCDISEKQVQVISSQEQCPDVADCPLENQYQHGCCIKCRLPTPQAHSSCMPEALRANETVRLVRTVLEPHGVCENYDAIPNFTECQGTCDSFTVYNKLSEHHDSQCQCCQPLSYSSISVSLLCEDGFSLKKVVSVPSHCVCEQCSESVAAFQTKGKPNRYIKA